MNDTSRSHRPRLLLMAYLCSPERGSEYAVGWHRAVQAARFFDTWVITGEHHEALREIRRHGEVPGLTFVPVPISGFQRLVRRLPGGFYPSYNLWHRQAFQLARQLHRELAFDLVHQVNYCGYREPGYLWKLDAPFVWGPVGGTQNYPWRFLSLAGPRGAVSEGLRGLLNAVQLRFSPRVRRATRRAAALLAANSTNQADFARAHGVRPLLQLETGLRSVRTDVPLKPLSGGPLRLLWSGDLQPWKALPLLLRALAQLPENVRYEVKILGRGPLKENYQNLAQRLGVAQHMTWIGWLPHREALNLYTWADVFVFTSLRDTSGNVVLEALGAGVPVVCLNHQGVRDIVTEECGIKIPVTTPRAVIAGLADALAHLAHDADTRHRLALGAVRRAQDFLWERQGERMAEVYRQVLAAHRRVRVTDVIPDVPVLQEA